MGLSFSQKLMKFFSSQAKFQEMEETSKRWVATCDCGYEMNMWEVGGVRYKAVGNKTTFMRCPRCGKTVMRTLSFKK